ncbi:MAG: hypothetical protein CM15mP79_0590 [Methanobacteriota archaeon]|nr:MAG: hypothetical protein CM15mP79_0590 [Euryarchaeota archaeon]
MRAWLSDGALLMGLGLGFEFDQQDVTLNFMRGRKEGVRCTFNTASSDVHAECCGPRSSDGRSTVACPSYHEESASGAASVSGINRWSPSPWMPTPAASHPATSKRPPLCGRFARHPQMTHAAHRDHRSGRHQHDGRVASTGLLLGGPRPGGLAGMTSRPSRPTAADHRWSSLHCAVAKEAALLTWKLVLTLQRVMLSRRGAPYAPV